MSATLPPEARLRAMLRAAASGAWLDRSRILGWSAVFLAAQALLLALFALWAHGAFGRLPSPPITDFLSFYAAGRQVLEGQAGGVYVPAAHALAEIRANGPGTQYVYFYYPPNFLIWCALFSAAPLGVAFPLTAIATGGVWLLAIQRILDRRWGAWLLPMLAFPGVAWTLLTGQNAFLFAGLVGLFTLWLDRRPALAGVALGFACFKPHLALAAPVALAAGGRWRTFAFAAATVLAWALAPAALFGPGIWRAYLALLATAHSVYETGRVDFGDYVTVYGALRLVGAAAAPARLGQIVVSVSTTALLAHIWRSKAPSAVKCAALCAGLLLSAPVALMYDLTLLTVAVAWIVRDGLPARNGDRTLIFTAYAAALVGRYAGLYAHLPLGPLPAAAILLVCLRRLPEPRWARSSASQDAGGQPIAARGVQGPDR